MQVQLNDPHPKKDENNEMMKSTCMSRFDLLNLECQNGMGPSAQETYHRNLTLTLYFPPKKKKQTGKGVPVFAPLP